MTTSWYAIFGRALETHGGRWWATSTEDAALHRCALLRLAHQATPATAVEELVYRGRFGEAEALLTSQLVPPFTPDDLRHLSQLLDDRRREAVASVRATLRQLRLRCDRLGERPWDEDLAVLIEEEAAADLPAARETISKAIDTPITSAESQLAEALRLRATGLVNADEIHDCIASRMWSRARHLIEDPAGENQDPLPLPPLAVLGVSPAWAIRHVRMGSVPQATGRTWRTLDDGTVELVGVVADSDRTTALAQVATALGLAHEEDGETIAVSGFSAGQESFRALAVFDPLLVDVGTVSLERLLRVVLSRGDRRPQLIRALLHGRPVVDVHDVLVRVEPDVAARMTLCLQLTSATTGDDLARALCYEAGHHAALARILLDSVHPRADVNRQLAIADVERSRLAASTVERFDAVLKELEANEPLGLRALATAADLLADRVDDDMIQVLVEDAPVEAVKRSLLASGLARYGTGGDLILGIEPLHLRARTRPA